MPQIPKETDFIVVGGGVAGLRAAIELAPHGRVCVITKEELSESNTQYAQGGVAVALSDEDEVGLHLQDTIAAGDGIVYEAAARILVEEGPERIEELLEWGTAFDREGSRLSFTREGAHSRSRVLHAHGDSTGREMGRTLAAKAATLPTIRVFTHLFTNDLLVKDGEVRGVEVVAPDESTAVITAKAVLLATGGAGQVYSETTNPKVATGDGIAMAYRAGAAISDMEFMQFHPTALALPNAPRFLISEAVRGEGASLVNDRGARFMLAVDRRAELAPRDVVARAIAAQRHMGHEVFLDLRHIPAEHIAARFPRIAQVCKTFDLDIARDRIPVSPAAHYLMGGIATDLDGRTTLPRLFAAGEAACTGVHGANRLASNSLLEGLVFGARAGAAMLKSPKVEDNKRFTKPATATFLLPSDINALRTLMWNNVGVERSGQGLQEANHALTVLAAKAGPERSGRAAGEARNLLHCAQLMIKSALAREESRGAHYRTDFPGHNDARFKSHSVVEDGAIRFVPQPIE